MENSFTTHNILITSFLLTHKQISLLEIKEISSKQFIFALSQPSLCQKLSKDYLNNAHAPARELFANREMLISEIKTRERNGARNTRLLTLALLSVS